MTDRKRNRQGFLYDLEVSERVSVEFDKLKNTRKRLIIARQRARCGDNCGKIETLKTLKDNHSKSCGGARITK